MKSRAPARLLAPLPRFLWAPLAVTHAQCACSTCQHRGCNRPTQMLADICGPASALQHSDTCGSQEPACNHVITPTGPAFLHDSHAAEDNASKPLATGIHATSNCIAGKPVGTGPPVTVTRHITYQMLTQMHCQTCSNPRMLYASPCMHHFAEVCRTSVLHPQEHLASARTPATTPIKLSSTLTELAHHYHTHSQPGHQSTTATPLHHTSPHCGLRAVMRLNFTSPILKP